MMTMIMDHPNVWGGVVVGLGWCFDWGEYNPLGVNIFQEYPFSWRWASCLDPNGEAWTEPIHSISNSCHHPLSSEYVIPHALIALALRKTYKKPTKPIKILWGSFGVSWFV